MRPAGAVAFERVPLAGAGLVTGPEGHAPARRGAPPVPVLREPSIERLAREAGGEGQPQAGAAPLIRRMGLEAMYPRPRTSRPGKGHKVYPYLLEGTHRGASQSGVGSRYLLPPDGARVSLLGRSHGVVQPQGARLAVVQCPQRRLLRRSGRGRVRTLWESGDIQYRPGGRSSPARRSPTGSRAQEWPSAWTARGGGWTTSSWNGCGGV